MASNWISKTSRTAIYTRDNMTCCYCGKKCNHYNGAMDLDTVTLDHIVSQKELAAASTDDGDFNSKRRNPANIVVVCNGCNSSKKHTTLFVWCNQTNKNYNLIIGLAAAQWHKEECYARVSFARSYRRRAIQLWYSYSS